MPKRSRSYKADLYQRLQDDSEALAYLQVAMEESVPDFLKALRNVAEARNVSRLAEQTGLDRVNMYRMLAETGNPRLSSLTAILDVLGLRLSVERKESVEISASAEEVSVEATFSPVLSFPSNFAKTSVCAATANVDTEKPVSTLLWTNPQHPMYSTKERTSTLYA